MNINILQEIGLTRGETKVYLALLHLGTTKTGPLAKKAEVSSSKIYKILDRLEKKGLVGHVIKGKIKYFTAMESNRILEYMEEKEKQFQAKKDIVKKLLPQLELERKAAKEKTEAFIFHGFKAISNFYRNILDELGFGETYYVLGAYYGKNISGVREFFYNYHTQRTKRNIYVKMLANYETKDNLEKPTFKKANIRFLPQYLMTDMTIVFYKNKSFIFFLTKDPTSFLIESKEVASSFQSYFETLWKIATPD